MNGHAHCSHTCFHHSHVDEFDVVKAAVHDGLVHLLVMVDALAEVSDRLWENTAIFVCPT